MHNRQPHHQCCTLFTLAAILAVCALGSGRATAQFIITEIIDANGSIDGNRLDQPRGIAVDGAGNVYATGIGTDNVFKITPSGGGITEIINEDGDGTNGLDDPRGIAVDGAGNVYVTGNLSDNVFKITPGGAITEIITASGGLNGPNSIAVDADCNVYVTSKLSNSVFKLEPDMCPTVSSTSYLITEIITASDGLNGPNSIAVDAANPANVYVTGAGGFGGSDNAFKITPSGAITEIITSSDGLSGPNSIAVDAANPANVYVSGRGGFGGSNNVFKITPGGAITEVLTSSDGLNGPNSVAVDADCNVYVTSKLSNSVFKLEPDMCPTVPTTSYVITEIITASNDLDGPDGIAVDAGNSANVYVAGGSSDNAFEITSAGVITEIIDFGGDGDGTGQGLDFAGGIAVDFSGNVYVEGHLSDNAFKITPSGIITEIIDGAGNGYINPTNSLALDIWGNVYVAGRGSDNAFKIAAPLNCSTGGMLACSITQIIDSTGDGAGNGLDGPQGIAIDADGNVYLPGRYSHNVFKIPPNGGCITQIIDSSGDGAGNGLEEPVSIAVDAAGNVFVTGFISDNAFKITPNGDVTEIIDSTGGCAGNGLDIPIDIAVDAEDNVYVVGFLTHNAFKIPANGECISQIIDSSGDGTNDLRFPTGIAVDAADNVYVTGGGNIVGSVGSDNVFKIKPNGLITEIIDSTGDVMGNGLVSPREVVLDATGNVYVGGGFSNNVFKLEPDCNGNGIPDVLDITWFWTSQDCNGNGIPDECDIADCLTGEPFCDDCNNNGIPDECDIASGSSLDVDGNGIPDECPFFGQGWIPFP